MPIGKLLRLSELADVIANDQSSNRHEAESHFSTYRLTEYPRAALFLRVIKF
jgi:hypothetical protein